LSVFDENFGGYVFKCEESEYEKIFWKNSKLGTLVTIREVKVELPNWNIHFFSPKPVMLYAVYRLKELKKLRRLVSKL
jgi:hypothetical protein